MNIDDYRAMVAQDAQAPQEQQQSDSQGVEQTDAQAQQQSTTIPAEVIQAQEEGSATLQDAGTQADPQTPTGETGPTHVEIDGQEVSLDELKNGYMRQSDYTRKTQEVSRAREQTQIAERYYKAVSEDPELAQELATKHNLPYVSPADARVHDLETKYQDLLLQQEINTLQSKYPDFDAQKVVSTAFEKKMPSLEDAYLLSRATSTQQATSAEPVDVAALTEQIRQQVMSELNLGVDTSTIISTGGQATQVVDTSPNLSEAQLRVAKGMKMTPKEYAKWSK